jgi:hypothetical protein
MPRITLRLTVDGREESLSEYICDWPDCPNVAIEVVGVAPSPRLVTSMCTEHAARFTEEKNGNDAS